VGLLILICLNILYVRYSARFSKTARIKKTFLLGLFVIAAAIVETLIIGFGFPFTIFQGYHRSILLIFIVSLLAEITIYCIVFIINYAITARKDMQTRRERAHLAQYRYMKLKGQVNPHFLFNSLNILDCLVCEEKTEQASLYIHKLAGIYRYMIKSEDEELVRLSEEIVFIEKYTDLLKVRFTEGFRIEMDIQEDCLNKFILPCSLQLLIENATKHNAISADNPLKIRIETFNETIRVRNNIIPKITKSQSTGLGHKYISRQYLDLCGKSIDIDITENDYCVTLPLL
jgi:LytS/YehU family sensor histidine kinase